MIYLKDSRGKPSVTLTFVVVAFIPIVVKFLFAGLTLPILGTVPILTGVDYAAAIVAVLGIWTAREYQEKK